MGRKGQLLGFASLFGSLFITSASEIPANPQDLFPDDKRSINEDGKVIVQGAGASFPNRLYQAAIFAFQFSEEGSNIAVSYSSVGSGKGICRILDYLSECASPYDAEVENPDLANPIYVDFAGSDSLLSSEQYSNYTDVQMYPAVAGAVVPIFNLPGFKAGELVLPREVIPRIFMKCDANAPSLCSEKQVRRWDDEAIVSAQTSEIAKEKLRAFKGKEIEVCVRADRSGTTEIFKKTMATIDPENFGKQVGNSKEPNWGEAAQVTKLNTNTGVAAYVSITSFTLGYSVLTEARSTGVATANIRTESGRVVEPTVTAVEFAVLEKGLDFGNNGDDSSRLTADILDAKGSQAWPIVGFTYFMVRRNSLRPGATCENAKATMTFLNWFYTNQIPKTIAEELDFAHLPENVRSVVLDRLRSDVTCDGKKVYAPRGADSYTPKVNVYGSRALEPLFSLFDSAYRAQLEGSQTPTQLPGYQVSTDPIESAIRNGGMAIVNKVSSSLRENRDMVVLPFAGVAAVAVFNHCPILTGNCKNPSLQLTVKLLAEILNPEDGPVKWNDDRIQALNPDVQLPDHEIIVIGTREKSPFMERMEVIVSTFTGKAFKFDPPVSAESEELARSAVYATQYSLGFIVQSSLPDSFVGVMSILRQEGDQRTLFPDASSVQACADGNYKPGSATDLSSPKLDLNSLAGTSLDECYPLSELYSTVVHRNLASGWELVEAQDEPRQNQQQDTQMFSSMEMFCADGEATTGYLGWLYQAALSGTTSVSEGIASPLETQGIAPLLVYPRGDDGSNVEATKNILLSIRNCDGTYILQDKTNMNHITKPLVYVVSTIAVVCILLCFMLMVWIHKNRKRKLVRAGSPQFLQQILVGTVIMVSTIFPLSLQDDRSNAFYGTLSSEALDAACQSQPFIFSIGFTIMFSALWLKTWRLNRIFINPKLRRGRFVHNRRLWGYQAIILTIVVGLNLVWLLTNPLKYKRYSTLDPAGPPLQPSELQGVSSFGQCIATGGAVAAIPLAICLTLFLLVGNYLTYRSRHVPSEYGEGKWLAIAMVTNLEAIAVGLPIWILAQTNPTSTFFVLSFIVLITSFGTTIIIFLPKVVVAYGWFGEVDSSIMKVVQDSASREPRSVSLTNNQRVSLYGDDTYVETSALEKSLQSLSFAKGNISSFTAPSLTAARTELTNPSPTHSTSETFTLDMLIKSQPESRPDDFPEL